MADAVAASAASPKLGCPLSASIPDSFRVWSPRRSSPSNLSSHSSPDSLLLSLAILCSPCFFFYRESNTLLDTSRTSFFASNVRGRSTFYLGFVSMYHGLFFLLSLFVTIS